MSTKSKPVPCDKKGRPIVPSDTSWQTALTRAVIFLALSVVFLPVGALLYGLVPLPENFGMVKLIFGMLMFFGALFLLFGGTIAVLALLQRRKTPPRDEQIRNVLASGAKCAATVTDVKCRTRVREGVRRRQYKLLLSYDDPRYRFRRKFVSDWEDGSPRRRGDSVTVWYHEDSNVGYFVDIRG